MTIERWLRTVAAGVALGLAGAAGTAAIRPVAAEGQNPAGAPRAEVEAALGADERAAVVERMRALLADRYVYPDVGEEMGEDLVRRLEAGEFDVIENAVTFAERLTETVRAVSHDLHLNVRVRPPERARVEREDPARARAEAEAAARFRNYGFERVERLEGNIGYLEIRFFDGNAAAKPTAAAALEFLANTDAVIIDLRRNGGGSPDMVRYVSSWFFGEPTHLNSLYWREGDRTQEFWTYEEIPGVQRPDVPLFVLTSGRTGSGAEEFAYNMRTQERATLVGETTVGAANPGALFPLNDRFEMFIATGAAVNPITGTNWEGVGVAPHVEVAADDALDRALELARQATSGGGDRGDPI